MIYKLLNILSINSHKINLPSVPKNNIVQYCFGLETFNFVKFKPSIKSLRIAHQTLTINSILNL